MISVPGTATVVGGCGFVGHALVSRLLAAGCQRVVVVDDLSAGRASLLPKDDRIHLLVGDATHVSLRRLGPMDAVFFLAGAPFVPSSFSDPEDTWRRNLGSLRGFLHTNAACLPQRFLYASSGEVYGEVPEGAAMEDQPSRNVDDPTLTPYAASRVGAERELLQFAKRWNSRSIIVLRLFNILGPNATHPYFVPEMIRQLSRSDTVAHGELSSVRDFVWIEDAVDLFVRAATLEFPGITAINASSGRGWHMSEVLNILKEMSGWKAVRLVEDPERKRPRELNRLVGNPERARALLNWRTTVPLPEAVEKCWRWYRQHGYWPYEGRTSTLTIASSQ